MSTGSVGALDAIRARLRAAACASSWLAAQQRDTPAAHRLIVAPTHRGELHAICTIDAASFDQPWGSRSYEQFMRGAGAFTLRRGAGADGIVGALLLDAAPRERTVRLVRLIVASDCRRCGVGTLAVGWVLTLAIASGADIVELHVREDNPTAARLYERLGFRVVRRIGGYYADGAAALRMRTLAAPARRTPISDV